MYAFDASQKQNRHETCLIFCITYENRLLETKSTGGSVARISIPAKHNSVKCRAIVDRNDTKCLKCTKYRQWAESRTDMDIERSEMQTLKPRQTCFQSKFKSTACLRIYPLSISRHNTHTAKNFVCVSSWPYRKDHPLQYRDIAGDGPL